MKTLTNTSAVTDNSDEQPVVTFSNPVTTVLREDPPVPVITVYRRKPVLVCCCYCRCFCSRRCERCCGRHCERRCERRCRPFTFRDNFR